ESFDELLGKEPNSPEQTINLMPAQQVFTIAARFIKIFNSKKDAKRFEILTRYVLASMDSEHLKLSYVSCGTNKLLTIHWIRHMKNVGHIACQLLESLHAEVASENRLLLLYLHLLLTLTATNTWRILREDQFQPLRPALNKLTENIMTDLVARGFYHTLN
ncbi:unnamed protein product, partial [Meganyctiphanes norvegica]